jgi:hypothetical protein
VSSVRGLRYATAVALLLLPFVASCGLPGDGSVRTVDDETVPYRLLESEGPATATTDLMTIPGPAPMVFWVVNDDRLIPSAAEPTCAEPPEEVLERLLDELESGPGETARAAGRSTAIPAEFELTLAGITDGEARVEVEPGPVISPERLPVAVGQVVLTAVSAAGVSAVVLVSEGVSVQAPLPGGALTDSPVTAEDYRSLLPERFQGLEEVGCQEG